MYPILRACSPVEILVFNLHFEIRGSFEVMFLPYYDEFGCCLAFHHTAIPLWPSKPRICSIMHILRICNSCDLAIERAT
jgi:hypothetical protein